jgi:hypothetical protein
MWIDYKGYHFMIIGSKEQGYEVNYRKDDEEERTVINTEKTLKKSKRSHRRISYKKWTIKKA